MYKVLIIDDEDPARNMLDLLIDWKKNDVSKVYKAENGLQGFECYCTYHPDIIITDIQMPVMDGLAFIRKIQALDEHPYFIILSCHESFSYAQEAIRLGVKDYLIKDMLTAEQLEQCLALARKSLEQSVASDAGETGMQFHTNEIFSRDSDTVLQSLYPMYLGKIENLISRFQQCMMNQEYTEAADIVRKLYQNPFEGLIRYHFLNYINEYIHHQVCLKCDSLHIPYEVILDRFTTSSDDLLLSSENAEESLAIVCDWLSRLNSYEADTQEYSFRIKNIISYLQENYYQNISLQDIATQFHVHKVYLARSFKSETGKTINEYIHYLRIEKAKLLLKITSDKINDIGFTVGYNSPQSFFNMFKTLTGQTPSEYRKHDF